MKLVLEIKSDFEMKLIKGGLQISDSNFSVRFSQLAFAQVLKGYDKLVEEDKLLGDLKVELIILVQDIKIVDELVEKAKNVAKGYGDLWEYLYILKGYINSLKNGKDVKKILSQ